MSKFMLKTYITALSLALLLSSRHSYAQFCQVDSAGQFKLDTKNLELPASLQTDYLKLAEKIKSLEQNVTKLKEQTLILTLAPKSEPLKTVTAYKNELHSLKKEIADTLHRISGSHRLAGRNLTEAYFQVADPLLLLEILKSPAVANMSDLQTSYSLALSQSSFESLYPLGLDLPAGIEAEFKLNKYNELNKHNAGNYTLMFSRENIFRALVRGAAQSEVKRKNNQNYIETVRCGLNRILIGKIKINQALLGRSDEKLNIADSVKVCLNTTAKEIENLSKNDVEVRKEKLLRGLIAEKLPHLFTELSPNSVELFNNTRLGEYIAQLRLFPNWLSLVNANKDDSQREITTAELNQAIDEINLGIENEYARLPIFKSLRNIWAENSLTSLFTKIIDDCAYPIRGATGVEIPTEILTQKLIEAEDFYFFNNLANDLELLNIRLTQMSKSEIETTLRDFIISRKQLALNQALIPVLSYISTAETPDIDLLLAAIQSEFKPLATNLINERLQKEDLDAYVENLTRISLENSASADSLSLLLETFTAEMIEGAKKIKIYLDENTPVSALPYDKNAIIRALRSSISALSAPVKSRFYILAEENDFLIQKQIWSGIESKVNAKTNKYGASCTPLSFLNRVNNWGRSLWDSKKSEDRANAQRDCDLSNIIATALGLKRQAPFTEFSDVESVLARQMAEDDLSTFIKNYKMELTSDIFGEYRLLDMNITKKQKLYEVLAETRDLQTVLSIVKESIEKSLKPLKSHLAVTASSKSEKDLDFFIKRTRIINALLGENDIGTLASSLNGYNGLAMNISSLMETKGFVFPGLINYHKRLQADMIDDEEINDQVFEEFLSSNINISMGIIFGWATQHALGILPRWLGGPSIAGLIHNVGNKSVHLIDGHSWFLMGMIGGHIGTLELKKSEFRTELRHVNDLTQSETLKPEGVENPLPLIEWSDYKQQQRYFEDGLKNAWLNQGMDLGWLAFPFLMSRAIQHGQKRMLQGLENKNANFEIGTHAQRRSFENKTRFSLNHKKTLMGSSFKDLKNPKSLDLTELQIGRDQALREAKTAFERNRINDSYDKIIIEFGSRLENVISHPSLLESYARAMFGQNGSASQARHFYAEFVAVASSKRGLL